MQASLPIESDVRRDKRVFLLLNVLGGMAVLGSYAHGFLTNESPGRVWGGVPEALRPVYTVNMFAAAAGYFPMFLYLFFKVDPDRVRVAGRYGFRFFDIAFALVLVPSALWMPLTFRMLEAPSAALWWLIRIDLLAVGVGALAIVVGLLTLRPRESTPFWALAVAGASALALQTAVLDALVWPAYFPR